MSQILKQLGFNNKDKSTVFKVTPQKMQNPSLEKKLGGRQVQFHTYVKKKSSAIKKNFEYEVLVVKENAEEVLGYRTYYSH